jgi:xylan 1,4-beta-xylosidase
MKYVNPIIPGFYPDPSICKYKDKYYMVHSTFQYFPGVTLFESKDLINWTQIGHVLTRESQLPLEKAGRSGGIFAPTIRCNNGRFYMVTTNVSAFGNFYVWTDDIYGEWSEPIIVDQGGIDPSLYFEDGKCYFMSNGVDEEGRSGIIQCEIDIETGEKLTPGRCIWNGTGGRYLEAPHLYKINGEYYILAAEGGTEYGHFVVCAKGKTPYGPFVSAPNNPILTNRNLGGYEIQGCGHGDLVEDENGNWWMVHLAFRQIGQWNMFHITGRETCLVPIEFDKDGWLLAGYKGTTPKVVETDKLPDNLQQKKRKLYAIENTKKGIEWCFMRAPDTKKYNFSDDTIELLGTAKKLSDDYDSPTFTCIRQCEMHGKISCRVAVEEQEAGITLYMDNIHHYDFYIKRTEEGACIEKRICIGDIAYVQESNPLDDRDIAEAVLAIHFTPTNYYFEAECDGKRFDFGRNQTKYLSTEVAEGFTGVMIGLYAQSEGGDCTKPAVFSEFICEFSDSQEE